MYFDRRDWIRTVLACILATLFVLPQNLIAQDHLVNPSDLQREMVAASRTRQQDMETVRQFLSSPQAEKAMRSAHVNAEQVKSAVSNLNDVELAQMAQRAQKAQTDFAAGNMSDRDLILVLLAIVALILIIVAVR
jgi:hypothetical protein